MCPLKRPPKVVNFAAIDRKHLYARLLFDENGVELTLLPIFAAIQITNTPGIVKKCNLLK